MNLASISQARLTAERFYDQASSGRAQIRLRISSDEPLIHLSTCAVTVLGDTENSVAFEAECTVRVEFESGQDSPIQLDHDEELDGLIDLVRSLADPYHRHAIAGAMAQAGMRPIVLPLPVAGGWKSDDD